MQMTCESWKESCVPVPYYTIWIQIKTNLRFKKSESFCHNKSLTKQKLTVRNSSAEFRAIAANK